MTSGRPELARRYLLGEATESECSAVEQEYFRNPDAVDDIEAAEEELIEDYLAGRLDDGSRTLFERRYLRQPHHRTRVETMRRLRAASNARSRSTIAVRSAPWLGLAAAAAIIAALSVSLFRSGAIGRQPPTPAPPVANEQPERGAPKAPSIFAVTIAPDDVRSQGERPPVVIPRETERVIIRLERLPGARPLAGGQAVIRAIGGEDVWRGAILVDDPALLARLDVPARALPPDDYVIEVSGTDRSGVEQTPPRYFVRVR